MEITCLLIEYGADVGIQDKAGLTPLHWASRQGRADIARILVGCGADVKVEDKVGLTPLHWASRQGRVSESPAYSSTVAWVRQSRTRTGPASTTTPWQDTYAAKLRTGERPLTVKPHPGPKTSSRGTRARNGELVTRAIRRTSGGYGENFPR